MTRKSMGLTEVNEGNEEVRIMGHLEIHLAGAAMHRDDISQNVAITGGWEP
jgi:hypothetical protein